jgi:2-polyprenyl-3-methyl-5-hydroxy-6-metoxy-1,4-benzoquinol methylase
MENFKESSIYRDAHLRGCHSYVLPKILQLCATLKPHSRVLDVGCGNGSLAVEFAKLGHSVTGIDLSPAGIEIAQANSPASRFERLPADQDILANLNAEPFDLVYSVEVIEHLYDPKGFLKGCFTATRPGGMFLCSTPYHGYLKNLSLSLMNQWDRHADPLDDGGHIKFFSRRTLEKAVTDAGFTEVKTVGSGRVALLWKSMIVTVIKPLI